MKYIIFDVTSKLQNSLVGQAVITSNPIRPYKDNNHMCSYIYKTQENVIEGSMRARVTNGKIYFANGSVATITSIPEGMRLVVFEPDVNFKALGTGHCKQIATSKIKDENVKDTAFFLACKKDGPKTWTYSTLIGNTLDFGADSTEAEILLEVPGNEKK
jgi:hypothetical protein